MEQSLGLCTNIHRIEKGPVFFKHTPTVKVNGNTSAMWCVFYGSLAYLPYFLLKVFLSREYLLDANQLNIFGEYIYYFSVDAEK